MSYQNVPAEFKDKWRERLFYQYKLYVDNIARLHAKEHFSLTLFIIINALVMVTTLLSLGIEIFVKIPWLDEPFIGLGMALSLIFAVYSWRLRRRYQSMYSATSELEESLPRSLIMYASPVSMFMRALQNTAPWFFFVAYLYILLSIHVFPTRFI